MIKKIPQQAHDVNHLESLTTPPAPGEWFDYRNIVVNKPWGYEYLLFENDHVAIWVLFLQRGARTSMHCHPKKKTSLLVLEGSVQTSSLGDSHELVCRDCIMIDRGVFHSTATDYESGSFIMEIETPPEKTDLVRLHDAYGRERKGYESGDDLSRELEKYEHHNFHDDITDERKVIEKVLRQSRMILHSNEDWKSFIDEVKQKEFCTISFLDTALVDKDGNEILGIGDLCEGDWLLKEYKNLRPQKDSFTVLTVH